ncbi:MAG TPA: YdeI/OmpD-associated family protein [Chitinophagaceae bacterium]|nr:YdeI/OmpD-associated family protein [Chitinophagaceae bacterium]
MIQYKALIKKFNKQGEKTGWTYIEVPDDLAQQLLPGNKKSFRVKGKLDSYPIKGVALLPIGGGNFIIPINGVMRKNIGKKQGATLSVQLQVDKEPFKFSDALMECLNDEPKAMARFKKMPGSHQKYFNNWIESAKTEVTKAKRIAQTITAMLKQQDFGEMLREQKELRTDK